MRIVPRQGLAGEADGGPSLAELAAIEAEWPVIAAELELLDAELVVVCSGAASPLDWRRVRRAQRRVLAARARLLAANRPTVREVA